MSKKPVELRPRYQAEFDRINEIVGAIQRYMDAKCDIPMEWIEEYNELISKRATPKQKLTDSFQCVHKTDLEKKTIYNLRLISDTKYELTWSNDISGSSGKHEYDFDMVHKYIEEGVWVLV